MAGRGTDIQLGGIEKSSLETRTMKISKKQEDFTSLEQKDMNLEELTTN